jgi:poly(3-hydroxybutyrate) depolymerase
MNLRDGDEVSAVALIVETEAPASTASDEPVSLIDENGSDDGVVATDPLDDPEGEN